MEATSLSTYDPTQCLAQIEDRESKRSLLSGEKNPAITFMKDVKNSLLFQHDWVKMLSAAPLSLSLMGCCYLAASSSKSAISLEDAAPRGGFRYLRYPTLKASLVQVSDTGRLAFITAEAKMSMVSSTSMALSQLMNQIVECIGNLPHPAAAMNLQSKLALLKSGSDDCCQYTKDTEQAFADWLKLVMELHQVSVYKGELTDQQEAINIVKIAEEELSLDLTKESEERALEVAGMMKEDLEMAKSAFKNAAANCPGPWESLAIGTAASIFKGITTSSSQIFHRIMHPLGVLSRGKRSLKCASKSYNEPEDTEAEENVEMGDPALAVANHISHLVGGLSALITAGNEGGVDWDSAACVGKNGLTYLLGSLAHQQKNFKFTDRDASIMLKSVIDDSVDILTEIKRITNKPMQLSYERPGAGSPKVQEWQTRVKKIKDTVLYLETKAASLPGNSNNMSTKPKKFKINLPNPSLTAKNAILANATERLKITETAYLNTQNSYNQASQQLNEVQSALGRIQKELQKLNLENATLAGIKKILIQCMGVLSDLKSQISELVRFFTAISCMVENVIKVHVASFMLEAKDANEYMIELGGTSLADFQRQNIYTTCLMVRAYFSLIQTIANMYTEVSRDYIMRGLSMCDELSKATMGDQPQSVIVQKNKTLDDYAKDVQVKLCRLIHEKQEEVSSQLQRRAEIVAAEITYIPKRLVYESKAAIEDGGRSAAESTSQIIDDCGSLAFDAGMMEFPAAFDESDL